MTASTPKSAEEIRQLEYDWLGSDEDGHVAFFSTAGSGYAPPEFLRDTDAHDVAIAAILAVPASTAAQFAPSLGPGFENTWKHMAERGVYAYDGDPSGGPYELVAAPAVPVRADSLPPLAAQVVSRLKLRLCFENHTVLSDEVLKAAA